VNASVGEEDNEEDETDAVEGDVAEERPPGELEDVLAHDSAHPDDEEDVEDG